VPIATIVCTADLEGRFTWVNKAWTQTLGYTATELCERNSFEFVHPDDQEAGYPHGLAGEAIPAAARIVALADVFDALTHARPYKASRPLDEALAEIRRSSGSHFGPAVVAAFDELDENVLVALTFESPTSSSSVELDVISA